MTTRAQSSRSNAAALKDTYSDCAQFESVLGCGLFHILTHPRAGTWEPGKVSMDDYF